MRRLAALALLLVFVPVADAAAPATLKAPGGVAVAPDGGIVVTDRELGLVVRIDPRTKARRVLVRGIRGGATAVEYDEQGRLHVAGGNRVYRVGARGAKSPVGGTFDGPLGFGFDGAGTMYVAEYGGRVRFVTAEGTTGTLAGNGTEGYSGDGGPAAEAVLKHPHDLDTNLDGTVWVADSWNGVVRRIDGKTRTIETVLAGGFDGALASVALGPRSIYLAGGRPGRIVRVTLDGTRTVLTRALASPFSIAVDGAGNVYASDLATARVYRIDERTRKVTVISG